MKKYIICSVLLLLSLFTCKDKKHINNVEVITYDIKQEFSWQNNDITKLLGYKFIVFKAGKYEIIKSPQMPFGYLKMLVSNSLLIDTISKDSCDKIIEGNYSLHGKTCFWSGTECVTNDDIEKLRIYSICEGKKLVSVEIIFLSEGETNGKKIK